MIDAKLLKIFSLFDVDKDGKLNRKEASLCLAWNYNLNPGNVDDSWLKLDRVVSEDIGMVEFARKVEAEMTPEDQKNLEINWFMIKRSAQGFLLKYD